ncbi:MAG: SPOR domain-containing protein, partial [Candidatus Electrothrix sp. AUS1_2]|nr:SPOR domain-containing protein [Candidatus Electrothrix sp. AUS1_2]
RPGTGKVQIIALCAAEGDNSDQEETVVPDEENDREDMQEEDGIPVLVAQGKKKTVGKKEAKGSERVAGAMCSVIRFDGKKLRIIRQNFDKGNFYIQVGSFEKRENARKLARTFADKGRDVVIQEFAAAGSSLFRVLVFSSTSLKEAKKHKDKLIKQGYEHAFVIAKDDPPKKQANRKDKKVSGKVAKN